MSDIATEQLQPPVWPATSLSMGAGQLASTAAAQLASFTQLLQQQGLHGDASLTPLYQSLYVPMAAWIAEQHQGKPLLLGINGGQGSGKSTLCSILKLLLEQGFNKRVVVISIDDLYLPRAQRQQLASSVHPLLATRGVPGTHDLPMAMQILTRLKQGDSNTVSIPRFDKAMDDRADPAHWQQVSGPLDIILFEGWCVGAMPQPEQALDAAINNLEADEDADGQWRRFVNDQLAGPYRELFALIDVLFMLKIPAMQNVFEWRLLQENKLRQRLAHDPAAAKHVMTEQQLNRFIMHYERITRASLQEMPARAQVVLELNSQHQVARVKINGI